MTAALRVGLGDLAASADQGSGQPMLTILLFQIGKSDYIGDEGKRGDMRTFLTIAATLTAFAALSIAAHAAPRRHHPVGEQPGSMVVQPTRTIIHNPNGTTTIIVHPRRSYLDPGTEVSVGSGSSFDYMLPPAGDPGRPYWFYGPSESSGPAAGGYMINLPYYLPGYNPHTPF